MEAICQTNIDNSVSCIICSSNKFQKIPYYTKNKLLGYKNKYKSICNDNCMATYSIYYDKNLELNT